MPATNRPPPARIAPCAPGPVTGSCGEIELVTDTDGLAFVDALGEAVMGGLLADALGDALTGGLVAGALGDRVGVGDGQ